MYSFRERLGNYEWEATVSTLEELQMLIEDRLAEKAGRDFVESSATVNSDSPLDDESAAYSELAAAAKKLQDVQRKVKRKTNHRKGTA
jgi:phage shock protein A